MKQGGVDDLKAHGIEPVEKESAPKKKSKPQKPLTTDEVAKDIRKADIAHQLEVEICEI